MLELFMNPDLVVAAGGLKKLQDTIINDWIGPVFILAVAAFGLMFIKDRSWRSILTFVAIAAIVGVLIFAGADFFASDGTLTRTAKNTAKDIDGAG